jgi:hypothetical protein
MSHAEDSPVLPDNLPNTPDRGAKHLALNTPLHLSETMEYEGYA